MVCHASVAFPRDSPGSDSCTYEPACLTPSFLVAVTLPCILVCLMFGPLPCCVVWSKQPFSAFIVVLSVFEFFLLEQQSDSFRCCYYIKPGCIIFDALYWVLEATKLGGSAPFSSHHCTAQVAVRQRAIVLSNWAVKLRRFFKYRFPIRYGSEMQGGVAVPCPHAQRAVAWLAVSYVARLAFALHTAQVAVTREKTPDWLHGEHRFRFSAGRGLLHGRRGDASANASSNRR